MALRYDTAHLVPDAHALIYAPCRVAASAKTRLWRRKRVWLSFDIIAAAAAAALSAPGAVQKNVITIDAATPPSAMLIPAPFLIDIYVLPVDVSLLPFCRHILPPRPPAPRLSVTSQSVTSPFFLLRPTKMRYALISDSTPALERLRATRAMSA